MDTCDSSHHAHPEKDGEDDRDQERRVFTIAGREIDVSLSKFSWECLEGISARESLSIQDIVEKVIEKAGEDNIGGYLKLFALNYYRLALHGAENGRNKN